MKKSRKRKSASSKGASTLISQGSQVDGSLSCESDLRIDGRFNGSIESSGDVVIGESAVARSNITAKEVIIAGKVYGDIAAEGKLPITSTGQMHGDVTASSLIIMEGGILNGASRMDYVPASREKNSGPVPLTRSEAG